MNIDQRNLCVAIDRACAELQSLKAHLRPSYIMTVELQAESAKTFASYAADILQISAALHIEAIETAANLAEHKITASDRADFSAFDAERNALNEICESADRMVQEIEEAA